MFGPYVADKYTSAVTKNLGLGCNSLLYSAGQIDGEDFVNFSGLFKKHELYHSSVLRVFIYSVEYGF